MRWRLQRFFYTLLVLAVIVLVAFLMLRSRYREIVTDLAETQVKNATSDLTNDAIAKQIANGTIQYDRIVYFEKNLDGRITALTDRICLCDIGLGVWNTVLQGR